MEFTDFIKELWVRKYLFLSVLGLCALLSVAVQKFSPRVYEAEALILVDQNKSFKEGGSSDAYSAGISQDRYLKSQVKIAQGEPVILDAIKHMKEKYTVTSKTIAAAANEGFFSSFIKFFNSLPASPEVDDLLKVQSSMRVEVETNTDLLRIAYRSRDPYLASQFANQIAGSFIERNISLYSNPLASKFFKDQQESFKEKLVKANKDLEQFAIANQIYSIDNQRKLELSRRDKVLADLSATRSSIGRLDSELNSLKTQLSSLKSKINLPSEIFGNNNFSGKSTANSSNSSSASQSGQNFGDDPPLLHVRLYQESAQKIINFNSELAGLKTSEGNQIQELRAVEKQLSTLATRAAEFSRLESDVAQYETAITLYARKSEEASIQNAWRSDERLSNMQLVQSAPVPVRPVFPRGSVVYPLGLVIGMIGGCSLVFAAKIYDNSKNS